MKTLTSLQQRIEGTNFINVQRLELLKSIEKEFKEMQGKKIQLAGGGHSAKWTLKSDYKKEVVKIKGLNVHLSFQWFFEFSYNFIILKTKVCINGGSYEDKTQFCQYIEKSDYIGALEGQKLAEVDNISQCIENVLEDVKNPLNEELFNEQAKQYKIALNQISTIKDSVNYSLRDFLPKY